MISNWNNEALAICDFDASTPLMYCWMNGHASLEVLVCMDEKLMKVSSAVLIMSLRASDWKSVRGRVASNVH